MPKSRTPKGKTSGPRTESYAHPEAKSLLRPDVGTQAQFRKKRPPATYRYDTSLAPALDWDGGNATREMGEWLLRVIEDAAALPPPHQFERPREMRDARGDVVATAAGLREAVGLLRMLGRPFLNWAGKAERLSFDVPTLPLFVHERLSTKAILDTLRGHKRDRQESLFDLFGDPGLPIRDQILRAYEHVGGWTNRLILGDSLVVMNSLLRYESLGGQVQMIYMDPPYGVKFGSNFQPFVRRRDVKHNDDEDMTREPEMVKAYRDTWELGLHSYLTYMRDRLLLCRDLLTPSGSIFVQISDENLHHVRELMDEILGSDSFVGLITYSTTSGFLTNTISRAGDYVLWYRRTPGQLKYRQLYLPKDAGHDKAEKYVYWDDHQGGRHTLTVEERESALLVPGTRRLYAIDNLSSQGSSPQTTFPYTYSGRTYVLRGNAHWKTTKSGLDALAKAGRLVPQGATLMYRRYLDDFPAYPLNNLWPDTASGASRTDPKVFAVQTRRVIVERCLLMCTDPGDLVLDPTCGSGTTAAVAEQWGRRWLTIDTSRVPLALARQRLLTATFPYYQLKEESRGPAGGFVYARKKNSKGEEVGGIVPHVTLKSIANDEPPEEEVLVDRPEVDGKVTRVTGPFCVEATIPTPVDWDADGIDDSGADPAAYASFIDRMLEVLRKSPVVQVGGGKTVTFRNVRLPAKTLALSAEATVVNGGDRTVALVFGPENGAVSDKLVFDAAREAHAKGYSHLYVIGFAIQPDARRLIDDCEAAIGVAATYVQATPDLMMADLLKSTRSSQIFSVCGLPEVTIAKAAGKKGQPVRYQVTLVGLDVFDPTTMEVDHRKGNDVPAWFLDTDYNGLSFHVSQAFFPRTAAWDDLKRSLRGEYEDSVWDHLAGTTSAPFEPGERGRVAVKVIDDRGNELLVVKSLKEAG